MSDHLHSRTVGAARRGLLLAAATVAACAVSAPAWAAVNNPPLAPHTITVFPERDFISAEGFNPGEKVTFEVRRNGHLIGISEPVTAGLDGLAEVNHPGGGCWQTVTPDILPGDTVRTVPESGDADETATANVTADPAKDAGGGTLVVHGTAQDANGDPLPLDQIEQRIISSTKSPFDVNGRRDLRAPDTTIGSTLEYDAPGSVHWTATYTGLDANDVDLATSNETRILWLGRDPLAGVESTIFEVGADVAPGPSAPCSAPFAQTSIVRTSRTVVNAANAGQPVVVDGVSAPDITNVAFTVGDLPMREATLNRTAGGQPDGTWTATISADDLAALPEGTSTLTVSYAGDSAPPNQSRTVTKDTIAPPAPVATPAAGTFGATQVVTLSDAERGAGIFYSNDGVDPTAQSLAFTAPLVVTASQTIKAIAIDTAGNASPVASFPFVIGTGAVLGTAVGNATRPDAATTARPGTTAPRALRALSVRSRISRAGLRRGLRVAMTVTDSAHVVRIRVYRARNGRRTGAPLLSTFRVPTRAGTFRVTLRSRSLLRRMRPGRYVVEVAAGNSRSELQAPLSRVVRVTR